jgi:hypothetical protein
LSIFFPYYQQFPDCNPKQKKFQALSSCSSPHSLPRSLLPQLAFRLPQHSRISLLAKEFHSASVSLGRTAAAPIASARHSPTTSRPARLLLKVPRAHSLLHLSPPDAMVSFQKAPGLSLCARANSSCIVTFYSNPTCDSVTSIQAPRDTSCFSFGNGLLISSLIVSGTCPGFQQV